MNTTNAISSVLNCLPIIRFVSNPPNAKSWYCYCTVSGNPIVSFFVTGYPEMVIHPELIASFINELRRLGAILHCGGLTNMESCIMSVKLWIDDNKVKVFFEF